MTGMSRRNHQLRLLNQICIPPLHHLQGTHMEGEQRLEKKTNCRQLSHTYLTPLHQLQHSHNEQDERK